MRGFLLSMLAGAAVACAGPVAAQYPTKPIRIVVPTPAGGGSDTAARILATGLAIRLGQQVLVENRPGAGGAIAAQAVLAAPPDGHVILWALASMAGIPSLQKTPPYRSLNELTAIGTVGSIVFGMYVHPDVAVKSVSEFVAYAKARPEKVSYGTGTLGEYLAITQLARAGSIEMTRVPYKGGAQLMPDLVAGRIQMNVGPLPPAMAHVKDGKLRMLAVLTGERSPAAPDVPTMKEAGFGAVALPTWQALFAPPKTPRAVVDRLSAAMNEVLREQDLRTRMSQQGLVVETSTPEALAAIATRDGETWRAFVREYDIPQE